MSRSRIVVEYIKSLERYWRQPLTIVETGTIRNTAPKYIVGDGHSTVFIAEYLKTAPYNHAFYSLDLDVSVAERYLQEKNLLSQVYFMQGNSLASLQTFSKINLAYLDSANNAAYVLQEFKLVEAVMRGGVVIIDDVDMRSKELLKGHLVVPYAQQQGYIVHLLERQAVIHVS